jgi:hypothetical protein
MIKLILLSTVFLSTVAMQECTQTTSNNAGNNALANANGNMNTQNENANASNSSSTSPPTTDAPTSMDNSGGGSSNPGGGSSNPNGGAPSGGNPGR